MIRSLHAEWTKTRTVPSTLWLLITAPVLITAVGAVVAEATNVRSCPTPTTCLEDTTKLSLTGVLVGQVAIIVVAVLAVGNEYGTGVIRVTLAAVPNRAAVFVSKLIVVSGLAVLSGLAGIVGAIAAARGILPANGFNAANGYQQIAWSAGSTIRAAGGTAAYLALIAVFSTGIAAVVRDTAGALITVLALLFVSPALAMVISDPAWQRRLERYSPMTAGLSVRSTRDVAEPWTGLATLAVYALAMALAGGILLRARDA
jgi:ABC-2 type transport system permease protein